MTTAFAPSTPVQDEESQQRYNPRLYWQRQDSQRVDQQQQISQRDQVTPVASSAIVADDYIARLQPIKDIGSRTAAGQVASSAYQRQQQLEAQKAAYAASQQAAYEAAMTGMAGVDGLGNVNWQTMQGGTYTPGVAGAGSYTGAGVTGADGGWGTGGAQGVANVLRAAGFPEEAIPTMMAIAKAESGWNPSAYNGSNRNGSTDEGLFQINDVHRNESWYPKNRKDPLQSARAAYALWSRAGGSYRDWSVYNSGAYRQYLTNVVPPKQNGISAQTVTMGNTPITTNVGTIRTTAIQRAIAYQNSGKPYIWGGNDLNKGVDCSGLVQQVYKSVGINLPRTAQEQAFYGQKTAISNLKPGDLVAWNNGGSRGLQVGHIAIYLGNNRIIESYDSGKPARQRALSASEVNSGYAWGVSLSKYVP